MILSGVLSGRNKPKVDVPAEDALWEFVEVLLSMNGVDGSTEFIDLAGHTVTNLNNNILVQPTGKFKGCAYFPAGAPLNQQLIVSGLSLGRTFTIEFWIKHTAVGTVFRLWATPATAPPMLADISTTISAVAHYPGGTWGFGEFGAIPIGEWVHVAFCFSNGTAFKAFINGTQVAAKGCDAVVTNTFDLSIGRYRGSAAFYIDDFRITKAVRYTTNFTPPSSGFA